MIGTPSAGRGLASIVSIPSGRRETGTECKGSFRRPLSYRLYPQDDGSTTAPMLLHALGVVDRFGDRRGGGGGVAGDGTPVGGDGYLRDCVGGARTVCAALSSTLYGLSSGLMGSDDAGSLSSPRATRACGLTVTDAERPPSSEARGCSVAAAERARGGGGGGSGDVAGGGTLVGGGGYLRDCVGGARTVCAALSSTLYGLSSGLTGTDDAGSLSSPRATRACGP